MKKMFKSLLIISVLFFSLPYVAMAHEGDEYPTKVGENLGNGVANIVTGFVEIPKTMILTSHRDGVAYGITNGFTMVAFELDKTYQFDIKKFWSGKFSEFTEYYKMIILSFHGAIENSILHGILGKTEVTKKDLEKRLTGDIARQIPVQIPNGMDLDSKPIMTQETFFFKDLRNFINSKPQPICNSSLFDSKQEHG